MKRNIYVLAFNDECAGECEKHFRAHTRKKKDEINTKTWLFIYDSLSGYTDLYMVFCCWWCFSWCSATGVYSHLMYVYYIFVTMYKLKVWCQTLCYGQISSIDIMSIDSWIAALRISDSPNEHSCKIFSALYEQNKRVNLFVIFRWYMCVCVCVLYAVVEYTKNKGYSRVQIRRIYTRNDLSIFVVVVFVVAVSTPVVVAWRIFE